MVDHWTASPVSQAGLFRPLGSPPSSGHPSTDLGEVAELPVTWGGEGLSPRDTRDGTLWGVLLRFPTSSTEASKPLPQEWLKGRGEGGGAGGWGVRKV